MNLVAHICAAGALAWLSEYLWTTMNYGTLGVAVLGLSLAFMLMGIMSIGEDINIVRKIRRKR